LWIVLTWPDPNREVKLEGDETQIALRHYRHGRVIKERSFSRASVAGLKVTAAGHMNGRPMKRLDLIVNAKAERVTRWTQGDIADAWADEVNRALGK
jgi:hypothetical protein